MILATTITCGTDAIALGIGWVIGGCTWLAIYLGLQLFTKGKR